MQNVFNRADDKRGAATPPSWHRAAQTLLRRLLILNMAARWGKGEGEGKPPAHPFIYT